MVGVAAVVEVVDVAAVVEVVDATVVVVVGGTWAGADSALASRVHPSVVASQKSARASLEGGKKLSPTTQPAPAARSAANGVSRPSSQVATRVAPVPSTTEFR